MSLLQGMAPKLRVIHLRQVRIPWEPTTLKDLLELHLQYLGQHGPELQEVMQILGRSPHIESLVLDQFSPPTTASVPRDGPIPLSRLKKLSIENLHDAYALHVLTNIHAPSVFTCAWYQGQLGEVLGMVQSRYDVPRRPRPGITVELPEPIQMLAINTSPP